MLGLTELQKITGDLLYKPGWFLEVYETSFQGIWFAISTEIEDSYNPGKTVPLRIKSPIPPMPDAVAFINWVRWRLEVVEIHECHEWLRYNGDVIFNPHEEGADEPLTYRPESSRL